MKTKLVLWGKNAQEERVLLGIELKPESNLVKTYIFSEAVATDDFANALMQNWRDGKEMELTEEYTQSELPLSVTDSIVPEGLTLERPDLLSRAQTEWHFVVLSSKLHDVYRSELEDFRDKIAKMQQYDAKMWDSLKTFWQKVHGQIKEQNLFREHADSLQNTTNQLFEDLKKLRTKVEEQFQLRSKELMQQFMDKLTDIEKRALEGARLSTAFEDLKNLQNKFKDAKFTKEHRTEVWNRLDGAFKAVKEKRFGAEAVQQDNSAEGRLDRRLDGLGQAMDRMEKSIQRDYEDLEFQKRKIAQTDGQLEAQIRQAKIKMIEERIRSKQERLDDMKKTQDQVEKQREKQQEREQRRSEKERIVEAKKEAEARIQEQIESATASRDKEEAEKLTKAAASIAEQKQPKESLAGAVGEMLSETLTDAADTVAAVASVVGEKAMEFIDDLMGNNKTTAEDIASSMTEQIQPEMEVATEAIIEEIAEVDSEKQAVIEAAEQSATAKIQHEIEDAQELLNEESAENIAIAEVVADTIEENATAKAEGDTQA